MTEAFEDAFRYDRIVFASITYNGTIFPSMNTFIDGLVERGYQNKKVAFIENGTWAPASAKGLLAIIEGLKNCKVTGQTVTLKSSGNDASMQALSELAEAIKEDIENN